MASEAGSDRLLEHFAPRAQSRVERRELVIEGALAALFAVVAAAVAIAVEPGRAWSWPTVLALVAAYAAASRVQFQAGAGYTAPTQLLFVPMLFAAPLSAVPLLVVAANALGRLPDYVAGREDPRKAVFDVNDGWHALGPVLVLAAAGAGDPAWGDWPVYVVALAAQVAVDGGVAVLRERLLLGAAPAAVLRVLAWVWLVDALLAPIGLLAAFATAGQDLAFLLVAPLPVALAIFAGERRRRLAQELELRAARERQREALELNDNVVQHLAVAHYLLERGEAEEAGQLVERGLEETKRIIGDLLDDDAPGAMRRTSASGPAALP